MRRNGLTIIDGTEDMLEWPSKPERDQRGIPHFGAIKYKGESVYKVSPENIGQLETIGWRLVHRSSDTYAYMKRPER